MEGWISLHRKILDNPVVCKDADHIAIWVYLLLNATHSEIKMLFGSSSIVLKPGQLITGRKSISEKFNISESKVQRVLKLLEIEHQIEQQTNNKHRLVTIVNWSLYQDKDFKSKKSEQQDEQQLNNERTTTEQQLNTNNNDNNVFNNDNKKNTNGEIENFFESVWELYPLKKGKGSVNIKQKKILQRIGYEEIKRCIERYVADQKNPDYYKHGSTFFNSGYIDYLDVNFTEQKTQNYQSTKNSEIRTGQAIDLSVKSWNGERQ